MTKCRDPVIMMTFPWRACETHALYPASLSAAVLKIRIDLCVERNDGSESHGKPPIAMIRAAIRRAITADLARKDTYNAQHCESAQGEAGIDS